MRQPLPDNLPKPSFRVIDDDLSRPLIAVPDAVARSFGYKDDQTFQRPLHYIRHSEPLETELLKQVEYDMDEQDQDWLLLLNAERVKDQLDEVSQEIFEVIMDQLEKEWFTLMKRVPKPDMDLPAEDSCCAICDDPEGENSNAIVFCDGCNLAVHQDCYGVPYIPEGQWLCRKCAVSPEVPVTCLLCPNEGGAFKQTTSSKWAHLLCAIWIPEVTVQNQVFMEPIEHIDKIPKNRWALKCVLCRETKGACIQCDVKSCYFAFHVTCARKNKLLCTMKTLPGQEEQPLRAFCDRHLPKEMQESRTSYFEDLASRADEINALRQSSKAARAYAKTYKTGIPLVPQYILDHVVAYVSQVQLQRKIQVVQSICKYWSLKREARRGAPLLKRLHLEPWTTSTSAAQQTDADRMYKLECLKRLRDDLITIKHLEELIQDREKLKLMQVENTTNILEKTLFLYDPALWAALNKITSYDSKYQLGQLDLPNDNPDYYEKVQNPISWDTIRHKLKSHEYLDLQPFKTDVRLVLSNAISYYPRDHELHKLSLQLQKQIESVLSSMDSLVRNDNLSEGKSLPSQPGKFEPSLEIIRFLVQTHERELYGSPEGEAVSSALGGDDDARQDDSILSALLRFMKPPVDMIQEEADKAVEEQVRQTPETNPTPNEDEIQKEKIEAEEEKPLETLSSPKKKRDRKLEQVSHKESPSSNQQKLPESEVEIGPPGPIAEGQDQPSVGEETATRKRKRGEFEVPVSRTSIGTPAVVDSVGKSDFFTMFESGWVLPEGTRRSRGNGQSVSYPRRAEKKDYAGVNSRDLSGSRRSLPTRLTRSRPNTEEQREEETISTPMSKMEISDETRENSKPDDDDVPMDSKDDSSSSLTDLDDDSKDNIPKEQTIEGESRAGHDSIKKKSEETSPSAESPSNQPTRKSSTLAVARTRQEIMGEPPELPDNGIMKPGTLVWAKQNLHPWFPGIIYDPGDANIPPKIHDTKEYFGTDGRLDDEDRGKLQVIRFFDKGNSWCWLPPKFIRTLFDDEARDEYILSTKLKSSSLRSQVREAYRRACKEKENADASAKRRKPKKAREDTEIEIDS